MANVAHSFRAHASFITLATYGRRPIFQVSRIAELFIDTLREYRARGYYKLHAFLVMPDHVHLLLTPQSRPLERTVASLQESFARRAESSGPIWAPDLVVHPIQSLGDLEKVRTYLHQTPVRARLTERPELYPYSSAHRACLSSPLESRT
jgi:putative transposase